MTPKSMLLWATYANIMDAMVWANISPIEQQRVTQRANLILAKWFLAVEAEMIDANKVKEQ